VNKVSAVIITKNESTSIERVCNSLKWCDEIVVVDSHSTDDTVEKAEQCGARVLTRDFTGYGDQKAFAVSQAKNRWVFSIDADEEVTPQLRDAILALPEESNIAGYHITRVDHFYDKILKYTLGSYTKILRLFNTERGTFNNDIVHESVQIEGQTGNLKGLLYHYSYSGLSNYFDKFNKYTSLQAQLKYDNGKRTSPIKVLFRFPLALFDAAIIKGGFLDGYEGLLMAHLHALYSMIKYAKLWELQRSGKK